MIEVSHVSAGYGGQDVLKDLSFSLSQGENLAILGPNGCGKTTLLRVMAGLLPCQGDVSVDGKRISRMKPRELAAHIGLMSQNMQIPFDYTVADVVRMGRYRMRRHGLFEAENREDEQAVRDALETVGLWALRDRAANTLSGQTGRWRVSRSDAGADAGRSGDLHARRADSQAGRVFGDRVACVFTAGVWRRCAGTSGAGAGIPAESVISSCFAHAGGFTPFFTHKKV